LEWEFEDHTEQTRSDESFWFITSSCGEGQEKVGGEGNGEDRGAEMEGKFEETEKSRKVKKKHEGSRSI
jgi:hypothetical protein